MEDHSEFDEDFAKSLQQDQKAVDHALDLLMDGIVKFKGVDSIVDIPVGDWGEMLAALDYAKFITSGIMYSYGMDLHVSHSSYEEDEDEEDE